MITPGTYATIACLLEQADVLHLDAYNELVKMQTNLDNTLVSDSKAERLGAEIDRAKTTIVEQRAMPTVPLVDAVRQLQVHVIRYYGSVDSFLSTNALLVSPYFASLSAMAGYTIAPDNIGTSCV